MHFERTWKAALTPEASRKLACSPGTNLPFPCAVQRARHSSGRKLSHPATVAPAGSNRSVCRGQLRRTKPLAQKVAAKAASEHAGHNMSKRRTSLEKGNVTAELLEYTRRPKLLREASDIRTAGEHRGSGDGMRAKERRVNTGDPEPRSAHRSDQPRPREGETGRDWESERPVVAMKRVTIAEPRGLSSRATQQEARARRLT